MLSCSNPGSSHPSLISAWQPEGPIQGPRDPETVEDTTIHWISGKLDGKIQWKNREAMFFPMKKKGGSCKSFIGRYEPPSFSIF